MPFVLKFHVLSDTLDRSWGLSGWASYDPWPALEEAKAQSVYWQTLAKQLVSGEEVAGLPMRKKRESILVAKRKEMYAKHRNKEEREIKQSYVYM